VGPEGGNQPVEFAARALLPVAPRVIWEVLTDYDRIASFVPGLKASRRLSGAGEPLLLEQRLGVAAGSFRVEAVVLLRVEERPLEAIRFEAVGGNLREMRGAWAIADLGAGSRLDYSLSVVTGFWLPPVLGPKLIRDSFRGQFDALTAEMMRRARAAAGTV
jgi:ribosome-associated toxin RatA of RatAB toxin-antitoxin module